MCSGMICPIKKIRKDNSGRDKLGDRDGLIHTLLLLLLSRFSRVRLCATPETAAPPGSPVPGILQAKTLEWVAISFSSA